MIGGVHACAGGAVATRRLTIMSKLLFLPSATVARRYYMWVCISSAPLDQFLCEFLAGIRVWSSSTGWVSYSQWGIRVYAAPTTDTANIGGFNFPGKSWFNAVFSGYFFVFVFFTTAANVDSDTIFSQLDTFMRQCVLQNADWENVTIAPYKCNRNFYTFMTGAIPIMLLRGTVELTTSTTSVNTTGRVFHQGGGLYNSNTFNLTVPIGDSELEAWCSGTRWGVYGFTSPDVHKTTYLLYSAYLEDIGISTPGTFNSPSYGRIPTEFGSRFFVISAPFPTYIFCRDFMIYAAEKVHIPLGTPSWFRFLSTNSRKPGVSFMGGTIGGAYNVLGAYVQGAHWAFCCVGFSQQWHVLATEFYNIWPLRSFYDLNGIGIKVYVSESTSSLQVTGLTTANQGTLKVPNVTVPSQMALDCFWQSVPGQENQVIPKSTYPWNFLNGSENLNTYGISQYIQADPPAPPAPTVPDPTPEPTPIPTPDPGPFPTVGNAFVGTNADFWNSVTNVSLDISKVVAKYPLLAQQYMQEMLSLRQFMIEEYARNSLKSLLTSAGSSETSWTLKQILTSNVVVPYNMHLVSEIVQWFAAIHPTELGTVGLVSPSSSNLTKIVLSLLDRRSTLGDILVHYPVEALTHGAHIMLLAKYLRTGTFP